MNLYNRTVLDTYKVAGAMYTEMDRGVGEVVEALKHNNMWAHTVQIFVSDNVRDWLILVIVSRVCPPSYLLRLTVLDTLCRVGRSITVQTVLCVAENTHSLVNTHIPWSRPLQSRLYRLSPEENGRAQRVE